MPTTPEHVLRNRVAWDQWATEYAEIGLRAWSHEPSWGIWGIPESQLRLLPEDLAGRDTVELGCGTGYVSAWLARRGARPVLTIPDEDGEPATEHLRRPYFGMHRFEWPDDGSVDFHLGHGEMMRLLRRCGLEVEDLVELQPPPGAEPSHPIATLDWARKWPTEEVWVARKR